MKTGGKVAVLASVAIVVLLVVAKRGGVRDVRLSGVTASETCLVSEPDAGGGYKTPKGIVVQVSKMTDEWAFVTIPASIADALFDKNEDVSGWVPLSALEPGMTPR